MAVNQRTPAPGAVSRPARTHAGRITGGGTSGNERLTAVTGGALLLPLAVIGVTLLQLRQLLSVHLFVGMLLIGPVALKLGSTGYRFVRYYSGNPAYRREGPPATPLRLIAPIVVLSTVVVLVTGVALLFAGPSSKNTLLPIHKVSFIVWAAFTGLHVLAYLPRLPRAFRADYGRAAQLSGDITGRTGRILSLAGAIAAGVVLAVLVIPEFGPWIHNSGVFDHHHG
ncbi:MAG: hypothetical protein JWM29_1427 [Solirubrobacterales bacterium]|jgi:hypothetical protein|nr:hypothetical protein [Solirubrobacterales bacterium]